MNRRLAAYGALALLSLTTARLVATDLATLRRRAGAAAAIAGPTTSTTRPGVPVGKRALVVSTDPPWAPPAGSLVDVYAPVEAFGGPSPEPARLVAAGARVMARLRSGDAGRVTLVVSVGEAREVAAAAATGPVVLALAPEQEPSTSRTSSSASSRE